MLSRRRARIALAQILYAEIFLQNIDQDIFQETYTDENDLDTFDRDYVEEMRWILHTNSDQLMTIIEKLSPKFDFESLPRMHVIILAIAIAEILHRDDIDEKISLNEAIELSKKFSDAPGTKFISGALSSFSREKDEFLSIPQKNIPFFQ